MSVKILERKKNPLLKREEVYAVFEHAGKPTPSRPDILPFLEKVLNVKKDLILIHKIFSVKGKGESKVKVFVYSKKEDIPKDKLEIIQRRMKKAKKEKPAETAGEAGKEEGPEEEKGGEPATGEEGKSEEGKEAKAGKEESEDRSGAEGESGEKEEGEPEKEESGGSGEEKEQGKEGESEGEKKG